MAAALIPACARGEVAASARIAGEGPAVVYVHGGFAGLGRAIRDQAAGGGWQRELETGMRLASYRRRGCSLTGCPGRGYTVAEQAEDLRAVLDRLHLTSVHLLGSSAGGPIAIRFATQHGDRVKSLILQGSSLRILRPGDGVYDLARPSWTLLRALGPREAYARRPAGVDTGYDRPWRKRAAERDRQVGAYLAGEARVRQAVTGTPIACRVAYHSAELQSMQGYEDIDVAAWASRIKAPCLVLHGRNDHVFGCAEASELGKAFPDAEVAIARGAGHTPIFTDRSARERVKEFVRRHDE